MPVRSMLAVLTAVLGSSFTASAALAEAPRQVTLSSSAEDITYGESVTVSGQISAPPATSTACISGVTVVIRGMGPTDVVPTPPPTSWSEVGRATSDATGAYSFTFSPRSNATYVAHLPSEQPAGCDEAVSERKSIGVRSLVELESRDRSVKRGRNAKLTVEVKPYCSGFGDDVTLQKLRAGEFVEVATAESEEAQPCVVRFRDRIRKTTIYRAMSGPNCSIVCTHEEGTSQTLRIRALRP